jgi:ABC-type transporter Mla subunit MlaD
MRERTIKKLERELRGQLLNAASRLLSTAEKLAADGRPQLLRTIVAISRSASTAEAAKTRAELAAEKLPASEEEERSPQEALAQWANSLKARPGGEEAREEAGDL